MYDDRVLLENVTQSSCTARGKDHRNCIIVCNYIIRHPYPVGRYYRPRRYGDRQTIFDNNITFVRERKRKLDRSEIIRYTAVIIFFF